MIDAEILKNAAAFRSSLAKKFEGNVDLVVTHSHARLDEAYARLTALQAWRSFVLEKHLTPSALGFYSEAQNDGLTSLALVTAGLWRPSLKSLRSLLENILQCLYYMDHPVEYLHWETGKNRPTFKSLFEYFGAHPVISELPSNLNPVSDLKKHYSQLSNAVHSSAIELRMTDDLNQTNIWKTGAGDIGKWAKLQKSVIQDTNLLILALMSAHLKGAANKGLRESLALVLPASKDVSIRAQLSVRIVRS